jgi:hypothetical protein
MKNYWNQYSDSRFQALTSLTKLEFEALLAEFQPLVDNYFRIYTFTGAKRKRAMYTEQANSSLLGAEMKLFFILYYLKNNSLQESIGAFFNICQGKVSMWTKQLFPLLQQAFGQLALLPNQDSGTFYNQLQALETDLILYQDATVRPIERPTDRQLQKEFYDGKHKSHTVKNHIVCDQNGQVLYVSPLYEGKVHDKRLITEENLCFPEHVILMQDTGYQGFETDAFVFMPKKKPRGKELSELDKCLNQIISSIRVKVEHVIGGIKISRMAKEKIRLKTGRVKQMVFLIASAIHNLRRKFRSITIQS